MTLKKYFTKQNCKQFALLTLKSVLGGLAIVLGTVASKLCPYPILAPLLFALGIGLVVTFDLGLITRYTPTSPKFKLWEFLTILVVNLGVAGIAGLFSPLTVTPPDNLFLMAVAGGAVIGLVSWNNIVDSPYKVALYLLIMYSFIELGLSHCIVMAFLGLDFPNLMVVVVGNIIGGLLIRFAIKELAFLSRLW